MAGLPLNRAALAAAFLLVAMSSFAGWNPNAVKEAQETIDEFKSEDSGLETFFAEAHGYAVFPSVKKGGLGIGGARGKGILFEQGEPVGEATLTQLTVGFQAGAQAYSEVIFFKDERAINSFKSGDYEFSAQVSAVAVTAGASADVDYSGGVAVFTMAIGGLMYEASVGGQKFKFDPDKD